MICRKTSKLQRTLRGTSRTAALVGVALSAVALWLGNSAAANAFSFTAGDLVISVEGNGAAGPTSSGGPYLDNQAAPLSLWEYGLTGTSSASYAGELVLPQAAGSGGNTATSGGNFPISGEYGSSSEGTLQLTGNGQYLTIAGYGINANTYNSNQAMYNVVPGQTKIALGQTCSLSSCASNVVVPRVVALIGANGGVNTSTAVYNAFNDNNPRSVYSATGQTFYISGQGNTSTSTQNPNGLDNTGGVFYTTLGTANKTPASITGNDAGSGASQETNEVQIYNNTLYVSTDSKEGATNRDFVGTIGSPPTTASNAPYNGASGPTMLTGFGNSGGTGKESISSGPDSNGNGQNAGKQINLNPQDFFFANSTTLYVADGGDPKNTSATSSVGDGGLQKWSLVNGSWVLDYTLSAGLDLVANTSSHGVSGLYGLTGEVVGNSVELFATSYTLSDTDETYLYGITDVLSDITNPGTEIFTTLATAPADDTFKGVAFAPQGADPLTPTPLPASWILMLMGLIGLGWFALPRSGERTSSWTRVCIGGSNEFPRP